jgi:CubicO group peptidase (beta-lactamase class C family)
LNERDLREAVEAARSKHSVPGVSAAFYADGKLSLAAAGVTNVSTGVEMTTDAIAHVGSITKLMNATLLMQLVDQGAVSLDHPITEYLPEFRVIDSDVANAITVEMLVNHTSGLGANLLPDLGHDNERIVTTASRLGGEPQLHLPGQARSYCNAGTVLAGYLCQTLTGKSWYELMKERIFEPLGMDQAAVLPEDALLHRASVGHFLDPENDRLVRTTHAFLPIGFAPAGSTNMMSARDLMAFTQAHLSDGLGASGNRILSAQSSKHMRLQSGNPGPQAFDSGIGWRRLNGFVGHGGGGPGIVSFVSAHPESQTAAVVLTNAEHGLAVLIDLIGPFMREHVGADPIPSLPAVTPELRFDPARYRGTYENNTVIHEVSERDGRLFWAASVKHQYYDSSRLEKPPAVELLPAGPDAFLADAQASALTHAPTALVAFLDPDSNGRARYLQEQLWLYRRREP